MKIGTAISTGILLFGGILILKAVGGVEGLKNIFGGLGGLLGVGDSAPPQPTISPDIITDIETVTGGTGLETSAERQAAADIAATETGAAAAAPWMWAGGLIGGLLGGWGIDVAAEAERADILAELAKTAAEQEALAAEQVRYEPSIGIVRPPVAFEPTQVQLVELATVETIPDVGQFIRKIQAGGIGAL